MLVIMSSGVVSVIISRLVAILGALCLSIFNIMIYDIV